MASREIHVPDIGNFKDVAIIEVLVKPGDRVEVDAPLLTLETEKATMDVPSPVAGIVERLLVQKGGVVSAGTPIAVLAVAAAQEAAAAPPPPAVASPASPAVPAVAAAAVAATAASSAPAAAPVAAAGTPALAAATPPAPVNEAGFAAAHASPGVRRFARELGADLSRIRGSGLKGRIVEADVKAYVKGLLAAGAGGASGAAGGANGLPRVQVPDFAQFGAVEVKPLGRVKRISGPRLHASWVNLPHVTVFDEADITDLDAMRVKLKDRAAERGVKLTPLAFVLRAVVRTLQQFPLFNASLDATGENLVYKKYMHLGFAADTPNGLMVPVIRDAADKDIYDLARALAALSEKARNGKLSGAEMQGGCFTVSSLGGIGSTAFTPIINAPELAILGVSRSAMKPVYQDGAFVPRLMLPLSLSFDHRVIDGAEGARFVVALVAALKNVPGLLEAVP